MPYAAIDLFCGVGGLIKGLEQPGVNVVAGIDFEPNCQYAYADGNRLIQIIEIRQLIKHSIFA